MWSISEYLPYPDNDNNEVIMGVWRLWGYECYGGMEVMGVQRLWGYEDYGSIDVMGYGGYIV